ncbi:hypothetical protein PGTUg99_033370 [Puccinia graminis f. sp. tritici]|uniref:Uncharacterized protein n=1 Tax=Puccinia graminis f. sp. tritici TaxID=56615 RepID=A0A5B0RFS6_PUCGR|nr:hypothetical protein PGTUg99_033370 [Puccinia graminis f. sp. tritici]
MTTQKKAQIHFDSIAYSTHLNIPSLSLSLSPRPSSSSFRKNPLLFLLLLLSSRTSQPTHNYNPRSSSLDHPLLQSSESDYLFFTAPLFFFSPLRSLFSNKQQQKDQRPFFLRF